MHKLTAYHASYFAHELTKRSASNSVEKLASALVDAQVDLNPHQVEAALFAFRSPLSKGAILADEVGLGKTIEAALVISQKWAERKRRILIVTPASLRKQWSQELQDKFFLPSVILEGKPFNELVKQGHRNPFEQPDIVICSYEFAASKADFVRRAAWDLVVLDEAHKLRNVYQSGDSRSARAKVLRKAVEHAPKVLLTATPLQNSLLELYGLVSIIDEYAFGDLKSFKAQYSRVKGGGTPEADELFQQLKDRLQPLCKRTLRRQVLEYVPYTNRTALVEEFYPTDAEQRLYDLVTEYLQRDTLLALPASQRKLMTLILRRLLASSSFAISGTLAALARRLETQLNAAAPVEADTDLADDFDQLPELEEAWTDEEEEPLADTSEQLTPETQALMREELQTLREFETLAREIRQNAKGEKLIQALNHAFAEATRPNEEGRRAARKAIIFTESTRTQHYLQQLLEANGYAGEVVLFNGSNNDAQSRRVLSDWQARHRGTDRVTGSRTADMRAALVEHFREQATIMIATEAAAEGINLQFCSLVVNYDMPWNPQRIEQRIGRCHRYGQKFDVVVLNFLNKANAADVRVYELLRDKFTLFHGVFGASDEVLGTLESGIDFEQRIARIYQQCRTPEEIKTAFDALEQEMAGSIDATMRQTRQQLLENFDEEVHEKLRINLQESKEYLNRYENWLWQLTCYCLHEYARFADDEHSFTLHHNPFPELTLHLASYRIGRQADGAEVNVYRIGHPLAQRIIRQCQEQTLAPAQLAFRYSNEERKISVLEPLVGISGWLRVMSLTVESFEAEDFVLLAGVTDAGEPLEEEQSRRLFSLTAQVGQAPLPAAPPALEQQLAGRRQVVLGELSTRNAGWFDAEMDKLDAWADDLKVGLEREIKDLDAEVRLKKAEAKRLLDLAQKAAMLRQVKDLEKKRNDKRRTLYEAQDEVDARKETLIEDVEARLQQRSLERELFTIHWSLS